MRRVARMLSVATILVAPLPAGGVGFAAEAALQAPAAQPPPAQPPQGRLTPPTFLPGETWDSMPRILNELRGLIAESTNPNLVAEAATRLWQEHHASGLVVLPTPRVEQSVQMHRMHVQELERSIGALEAALRRPQLAAEAVSNLLAVKVALESEVDWIQTLGKWTATVVPNTPQARLLEGRQIRAPFIPLPFLPLPYVHYGPEEAIENAVVGINQCMVVLKEIQGMKVRLVPIELPVWIEPWYARRAIVGYVVVWIVEFVPSQFLKRVVTCNDCCNKITTQVLTEVVEHPELLDFWSYFRKGHHASKAEHAYP